MKKQEIELLSPAGSYEGFEAAIGAGADAVYVGGPDFGARAYAQNFTQEELIRAIRTAHIHGRKLYLTVNTLLKNREIREKLFDSLKPLYEAGLDAVIVQDLGVFQFIRRNFPEMHIHASTQMAITGPKGMKFLEEQGATRVVAARELSLTELAAMHRESSIEIEAFIHGALCYSFSGQCLMSSILGGRSGNRGRCAQPCRLPYQVRKGEDRRFSGQKDLCPLSLKDICTLDILPQIIDAGVISLKIEGRMKQPGYTAGVTGMYRKYLDILLKNRENYQVTEEDRKYILDIFNRGGSCTGYYKQHNGPSMMAFSNEKKTGGVSGEFKKCREKLTGILMLYPESPAILQISCGDKQVVVSEGEVQFAKEHPMSEERIRKQMEKLGNTEFEWESLDIQMEGNIFVPVKLLNELRRNAMEALEEELCAPMYRKAEDKPKFSQSFDESGQNKEIPPMFVSCETISQSEAAWKRDEVRGLYLPYSVMEQAIERGIQNHKELYLSLPYITRGEAPEHFFETSGRWLKAGMKGFLVRNLESYGMLREQGFGKYTVLDATMYTWNNEAVDFWDKQGILKNTVPLELKEAEMRHRNNQHSELIVYGYIPLMQSAQCVRRNIAACDMREGSMTLKDRYDKEFTAVCVCHPWKTKTTEEREYCYNIIYNSLPYGLLGEAKKVLALGMQSLRISLTMESSEETERILDEFLGVYYHNRIPAERNFTKGHFKRGAE
ncbi:MAG: U32 family peptidase [Eubacteriales bacterium]|nr:U32 family peptidase [Eubacteriales bacterium]